MLKEKKIEQILVALYSLPQGIIFKNSNKIVVIAQNRKQENMAEGRH